MRTDTKQRVVGRGVPLTRPKMRQRATQFPKERVRTRETTTRVRGQVRGPPRTACTLLARARMRHQAQQVAGGAAERRLSPQLFCRPRRSLYRDKQRYGNDAPDNIGSSERVSDGIHTVTIANGTQSMRTATHYATTDALSNDCTNLYHSYTSISLMHYDCTNLYHSYTSISLIHSFIGLHG